MLNRFKNQLLKKIKKNKTVSLIGRGPTSRFFKNKSSLKIGINLEQINNINFEYLYKENNLINKQNNTSIKIEKYSNFKIGSVPFALFNVLEILNSLNMKFTVYLYGFDFNKFSDDDDILKQKRISGDYRGIQENIDVNTQLFAFNTYKSKFKNLKINKFGFDIYSDFNKKIQKKNSLEIISEFTTNHQGNTNKLEKLLEASIQANCKCIKFQRRDVENFYDKKTLNKTYITPISNSFFEYRKKLEFDEEQLELIKYYTKKNDLKVIFSALDTKSYLELKKKGFKYFKVPSTISYHKKFINFIADQKDKLTYISTGMTDQRYVKYILNKFRNRNIVLMHAISAYPTKFENINLGIISEYKKLSEKNKKIIPGYSSHDVGYLGCMLAVAAGARVIEKHIKIGHTPWMHFDDTAIDAKLELPIFVEQLNKTFISIGDYKKKVYKFEHHKYKI